MACSLFYEPFIKPVFLLWWLETTVWLLYVNDEQLLNNVKKFSHHSSNYKLFTFHCFIKITLCIWWMLSVKILKMEMYRSLLLFVFFHSRCADVFINAAQLTWHLVMMQKMKWNCTLTNSEPHTELPFSPQSICWLLQLELVLDPYIPILWDFYWLEFQFLLK